MRAAAAELPRAPGTYVLVLALPRAVRRTIGRHGTLDFAAGTWLYVGSAFGAGGLRARVARHCRRDKPRRWHLDYLRPVCAPIAVAFSRSGDRLEHEWAQALAAAGLSGPPRFGASDCRCPGHLFACAGADWRGVVAALPCPPADRLALTAVC